MSGPFFTIMVMYHFIYLLAYFDVEKKVHDMYIPREYTVSCIHVCKITTYSMAKTAKRSCNFLVQQRDFIIQCIDEIALQEFFFSFQDQQSLNCSFLQRIRLSLISQVMNILHENVGLSLILIKITQCHFLVTIFL